jgi:hypothetical protein
VKDNAGPQEANAHHDSCGKSGRISNPGRIRRVTKTVDGDYGEQGRPKANQKQGADACPLVGSLSVQPDYTADYGGQDETQNHIQLCPGSVPDMQWFHQKINLRGCSTGTRQATAFSISADYRA